MRWPDSDPNDLTRRASGSYTAPMKRLVLALMLVPGLAFADGDTKDPKPAEPPPPPAPKVLDTKKPPRPISIVDDTKDGAAGDRHCEPNALGQIVCTG